MRFLTIISLLGLFSPVAVLIVGTTWPSAFSGYESALQALGIALAFATPCALFLLFRVFRWLIGYLKRSSHSSPVPHKVEPGHMHFHIPE